MANVDSCAASGCRCTATSSTDRSSRPRGRCSTASRSRAARRARPRSSRATYTGLVPDTFKSGAEVVAKGTLDRRQPAGRRPRRHHGQVPVEVRGEAGRARLSGSGPAKAASIRSIRSRLASAVSSAGSLSVAQAVDGAAGGWRAATGRASPESRSPAWPRRPPMISAAGDLHRQLADEIDLRIQRVAVEPRQQADRAARRRSRGRCRPRRRWSRRPGRCARPSLAGAPIDFRIAISRTLDSTIIVSEAMMLNAATTMISTSRSEMITFCMVSAMKRLWFSSFQSMTR